MNVALFGKTAKEWRQANPDAKGNIRDEASLLQLIALPNMESLNDEFIRQGLSQKERLLRLNASAKQMMRSLLDNTGIERLKQLEPPNKRGYKVYIATAHIENFRNFSTINVPLKPFAIIVGKNDSGKSNLVDAINILL